MPSLDPSPSKDYIPATDEAALAWMQNIVGTSADWSFQPDTPTVVQLTAATSAFENSLIAATSPSTRTSLTVAGKNTARASAEVLFRAWAGQVLAAHKAGLLPDSGLVLVGLRVPKTTRTPVPAPTDSPLLGVDSVSGKEIRCRVTQGVGGSAVSTRRFDRGYAGVEIQMTAGNVSRSYIARRVNTVADASAFASGSAITLQARYVTRRGLQGPWSNPVVVTVW